MDKDKARKIINGLLAILNDSYIDYIMKGTNTEENDYILSVIREELDSNVNNIIKFIEYLRKLEPRDMQYNIKAYTHAQNVMYMILNTVLMNKDNIGMSECRDMYNALIAINKEFLYSNENYSREIIQTALAYKAKDSLSDYKCILYAIEYDYNVFTLSNKIKEIQKEKNVPMDDLLGHIMINGLSIDKVIIVHNLLILKS